MNPPDPREALDALETLLADASPTVRAAAEPLLRSLRVAQDQNEAQMMELLEVLTAFAALDLSRRAPVGDTDTLVDALGHGFNMLGEELEASTVSRALLSDIIESIADAVVVSDGALHVAQRNAAAVSLFGGLPVGGALPTAMRQAIAAERSGGPALTEAAIPHAQGEVPVSLQLSSLTEGNGFVLVARNISSWQAAQEKERALLARTATQRGRIDMARGILHDLGNVLSGIGARIHAARANVADTIQADSTTRLIDFLASRRAALETALGEQRAAALLVVLVETHATRVQAGEELNEDLTRAGQFAVHASELITNFRTYSGVGSTPNRSSVDIRHLLLDAKLMMVDGALKRDGRMETWFDEALPVVQVDPTMLMQVLINLIKNALEATDEVPVAPHLIIRARATAEAVVLEVEDNGSGFDASDATRLFEAGYSSKQRGSGHGLASARRVIDSLGGRLALVSDGPGLGATARIELPLTGSDD